MMINSHGEQTINGVKVHFDDFTGIQVKGHLHQMVNMIKILVLSQPMLLKEILTYIGRDDINQKNVYTTAWYYSMLMVSLTGPQTFGK